VQVYLPFGRWGFVEKGKLNDIPSFCEEGEGFQCEKSTIRINASLVAAYPSIGASAAGIGQIRACTDLKLFLYKYIPCAAIFPRY
jgi:hypothetical protein